MGVLGLLLIPAAMVLMIVVAVLIFCWWLVRFTGRAESLHEVVSVLRALRDFMRLRRR